MFARFRISLGLAVLAGLLASSLVFAKGGFAFITIRGTNVTEPIRATEPALIDDFFAFADFYRNKTDTPANPGTGYEITRYYVDGSRELAFDRLHYYPETGYVFYDGIVNGSSEYDNKWYAARPEIEKTFEGVLSDRQVAQTRSGQPGQTVQASSVGLFQSILFIFIIIGFALVLWLASSRPKTSV